MNSRCVDCSQKSGKKRRRKEKKRRGGPSTVCSRGPSTVPRAVFPNLPWACDGPWKVLGVHWDLHHCLGVLAQKLQRFTFVHSAFETEGPEGVFVSLLCLCLVGELSQDSQAQDVLVAHILCFAQTFGWLVEAVRRVLAMTKRLVPPECASVFGGGMVVHCDVQTPVYDPELIYRPLRSLPWTPPIASIATAFYSSSASSSTPPCAVRAIPEPPTKIIARYYECFLEVTWFSLAVQQSASTAVRMLRLSLETNTILSRSLFFCITKFVLLSCNGVQFSVPKASSKVFDWGTCANVSICHVVSASPKPTLESLRRSTTVASSFQTHSSYIRLRRRKQGERGGQNEDDRLTASQFCDAEYFPVFYSYLYIVL